MQERSSEACVLYTRSVRRASGFVVCWACSAVRRCKSFHPCRLIWKVLHESVHYVELGPTVNALTLKRRKQRLVTQRKKARIFGSANTGHGPGRRPISCFEGVAGVPGRPRPLCRSSRLVERNWGDRNLNFQIAAGSDVQMGSSQPDDSLNVHLSWVRCRDLLRFGRDSQDRLAGQLGRVAIPPELG